ncbi:hypothetical protein [Flavobacterium pallidum]|uniref:UDP-glycosyltransferase n=1 Tax=Flavobacterium pallidum TaxID=2172098 RepID=A0A2S1SH48_9FLAO|nr:hypothetical protein [Flavobacterium pallidum]AWI25672.1 hypothetical protein HYN49_07035 [Flavobacterium pallidum]
MAKLGVVITDGVGFRNFILTDFIKEANKNFNQVVIYSFLPAEAYNDYKPDCKIVEMDVYSESFITWFFRKSKEVAHLRLHKNDNFGILDSYNINRSKSWNTRGLATRFIFAFTAVFHSERWILRFNRLQQLSLSKSELSRSFDEKIDEDNIDLLFFTHQRPPFIAPLIYQAERRKIKTASFIFSWDNLASKGRMAGNFDFYLVWSDLMKSELLQFYKSVNAKQIAVVGTPQFEPYVMDNFNMEKEAFFKLFGFDATLPVICFTCNDSSSKNDPLYIEDIADAIKAGQIKANLMVRTSPADVPRRFLYLKERYPFIYWNFPDWVLTRDKHAELWSQRVPSFHDIVLLKALLKYSDVSVNILSTIILDAFLFDTPAICPVYGDAEKGYGTIDKFLDYGHLRNVVKSKAVAIPATRQAFLNDIENALQNPESRLKEQQDFVAFEIGKPIHQTSARIAEVLSGLV